MLRRVSDEDVQDAIIRGLRRREPTLDIVRAVDIGLDHTPDAVVLEWRGSGTFRLPDEPAREPNHARYL